MNGTKIWILHLMFLLISTAALAGQFTLKYVKPENADHLKLYKVLSKNDKDFFGDAIKFLNELYQIPNDVQIVVADCGSRNSRYNLAQITIYICYETLQYKIKDYRTPPENYDQYVSRVFKNSVFTFWHEIGHALIHQKQSPTSNGLLNEEDLADEFAVLSMIWRKDDKWTNAIVTSSLHYKNKVRQLKKSGIAEPKYENHSPNIQRYYNMTCLLYGVRPVTFKRLKEKLDAESRGSSHCKSYYNQRDQYWSRILKPHTKYVYFK